MFNKEKLFSLQQDPNLFLPATDEEKEYMVQMRESSTFFKDGVKRLMKNNVAVVSIIVIIVITLSAIIVPMFWPYSYDRMLGVAPGKQVDNSYNNPRPFEYGEPPSRPRWTQARKSSLTSSGPTPRDETTSYEWSTAPGYLWRSGSLRV